MTVANDNSPAPGENLPSGLPLDSAAAEPHDAADAPGESPSHAPVENAAVGNAAVGSSAAGENSAEHAPVESEAVESAPLESTPLEAESDEDVERDWYILKVQSNREESIKDGLLRRVRIRGLDKYFGEVIVPTEMVTEFKNGKKRVVKRKLYPGYIIVNMAINDDTWFLVRETPGIGDFTGAGGKPVPMLASEVSRFLAKQEEKSDEAPKLKINFKVGDRVKINEGTFENFEGAVETIDDANGRVTVMINIFGRSTPVELEYWQVENV